MPTLTKSKKPDQPENQIAGVRIQLDILRKQGILIDLNISGTGMFTRVASFRAS